jgi:hypothetical protein
VQSTSEQSEVHKRKRMETMAIDGHCRGSERSHNKGEKDAKENGIKKMSQGGV